VSVVYMDDEGQPVKSGGVIPQSTIMRELHIKVVSWLVLCKLCQRVGWMCTAVLQHCMRQATASSDASTPALPDILLLLLQPGMIYNLEDGRKALRDVFALQLFDNVQVNTTAAPCMHPRANFACRRVVRHKHTHGQGAANADIRGRVRMEHCAKRQWSPLLGQCHPRYDEYL
jgi:hypothetical protein